jgi:hypothetical protein
VYFTRKELPEHNGDPYYFLKVQLSWLGKTYDPERWIDYRSSRERLHSYLAENSIGFDAQNPMNKDEQREFRKTCFDYLCCLRNPPESFLKARKRHTVGSGDYPGKSKLNEVFTDIGIPYQVKSRQNKAQKKDKKTGMKVLDPETGSVQIDDKSYWYLVSVDAGKEQERLEAKRKEKQIKQAERKAEKARAEEQKPQPEKVKDPDNPFGVEILNYPKKKEAKQAAVAEKIIPETKVKPPKIKIMSGDEPWTPSMQKER